MKRTKMWAFSMAAMVALIVLFSPGFHTAVPYPHFFGRYRDRAYSRAQATQSRWEKGGGSTQVSLSGHAGLFDLCQGSDEAERYRSMQEDLRCVYYFLRYPEKWRTGDD